jgi:hypothetical protein
LPTEPKLLGSEGNAEKASKINMGRYAHKTKSQRKIITIQEWANYIGVSKNTMLSYLQLYRLVFDYDPKDIYSVLKFHKYLIERKKPKGDLDQSPIS